MLSDPSRVCIGVFSAATAVICFTAEWEYMENPSADEVENLLYNKINIKTLRRNSTHLLHLQKSC